jgi:hypothetical protein
MGRHSPRHGERIIAFRVMRPLQIEFFRSLLEGKHLPSCISALRAVPKRASGKLERQFEPESLSSAL